LAETVDETDADRVGALHENDRDGLGRCFGSERTIRALQRHDHGYLTANQFRDQRREPIVSTFSPPIFDRHVLALDVPGVGEAAAKGSEKVTGLFEGCQVKEPNHRRRWLLRTRGERLTRGCRAAKKRDELPPPHSITSSARASSVGGTVRPSAFDVKEPGID
jgi:hypothetical protein